MTAILVAFFGVVIAVNLLMARLATSTFGGVVVENSYVASQHFNRWLDEAERERALGWNVAASRRPDNRIELSLTGAPEGAKVTALAWHPLGRMPDVPLTFASIAPGRQASVEALPEGRWEMRISVEADGRVWRTEQRLQ